MPPRIRQFRLLNDNHSLILHFAKELYPHMFKLIWIYISTSITAFDKSLMFHISLVSATFRTKYRNPFQVGIPLLERFINL